MFEVGVTFESRRPTGTVKLEGRLHLPEAEGPAPGVVLCHPHPMGGGQMDVPLMTHLADSLAGSGVVALRFNFGGVGASGGEFTGGDEEPTDVLAALEYLRSREEVGGRVSVVGWSFGAWMGLVSLAEGARAAALVAIAPPLAACDWRSITPRIAASPARRYYIVGECDRFCSVETLRYFAGAVSEEDERSLVVLPGADHFLFGREREVADLVTERLTE